MHSFLDEARIFVRAGSGGAGAMHFHREKFVPRGGPDGGDGGNGGGVFLRADAELNTLFAFKRKRRFAAEDGQAGGANRMHGRTGKDLIVDVPVGTVVRDVESGDLLGDLHRPGQLLEVARGGKGGLGNVHFKTSTNQAPGFAEKGEPGTERWLDLELKLIADVGLIGQPNAGKSTLLSVMSAARPKIADYPFTTLTPNLGVVEAGDSTFVAADIPGLIEGAHAGVGLGHDFLRHIERTMVLLHVVDGSAEDPLGAFEQVLAELQRYDPDLAVKPQVVVVNKMDLPAASDGWPALHTRLRKLGYESLPVSAAAREGVDDVIYRASQLLREQRDERAQHAPAADTEVIRIKPPADRFHIERRRGTFHVSGETVERLAVMTDIESEEALHRLDQRLRRMGLFAALERAGIRNGNKVKIGDVELVWDETLEPAVKRR